MKFCLFLLLVNTLAWKTTGSENAEWWTLETTLEKGFRELEFIELVVSITTMEPTVAKEDLETIRKRTESLHSKFSHLTPEASKIVERIQTQANLLASQSVAEMVDLLEEEEMLLNLVETVMKTRERIGTIREHYLEYESTKAEEEWLEMELEKDLTLFSEKHPLNTERTQEVVILKKMFRTKVREIIDSCDSYMAASEAWTFYYDLLDKLYQSIEEEEARNDTPEEEADGDERNQILTETRQFLRAYKEVVVAQENKTVGSDLDEHTEL